MYRGGGGGGMSLDTPQVVPGCAMNGPGVALRWHARGDPAADPSHSHARHPAVLLQSMQHDAKSLALVQAKAFAVHEVFGCSVMLHVDDDVCSGVVAAWPAEITISEHHTAAVDIMHCLHARIFVLS